MTQSELQQLIDSDWGDGLTVDDLSVEDGIPQACIYGDNHRVLSILYTKWNGAHLLPSIPGIIESGPIVGGGFAAILVEFCPLSDWR